MIPPILENEQEAAHARYGPSSMARIIGCKVSTILSEGLTSKKSKYADEGDAAHALCEYFGRQALKGKPISELTIIGRPAGFKDPDDEMIRHSKGYAAYISTLVRPHLSLSRKSFYFFEHRVTLSKNPQLFGTADFIFCYQTEDGFWHLIIVDLKYGEGVIVDPEENWQTISYALFAIADFESSGVLQKAHDHTGHPRAEASIQTVEMHIYQPRVTNEVRPQFFTREELVNERWPIIEEAVLVSEQFFERKKEYPQLPNEALVSPEEFAKYQVVDPKGKYCQFCKFKPKCKALADSKGLGRAVELLGMVTPAVEAQRHKVPQEFTPTGRVKKPPSTEALLAMPDLVLATGVLTPEDRAFLALNANAISNFVKAVKEGFKEDLNNGLESPYAYLGKASDRRGWIDDEDRVKRFLAERGITNFITQVPKKLGIGDVEKVLGKGTFDEITQVVSSSKKLVPAGSGAEPAPPKGFNTTNAVKHLLGMKREDEELEEDTDD